MTPASFSFSQKGGSLLCFDIEDYLLKAVIKETRCVNTTLESYEDLANHWRTVLGLDVEPWRLLAVELLRLEHPIVSASCLEGIAAIKDVVLNGVCGADARQNLDAGGEADLGEANVDGLVHAIPFDAPPGVKFVELTQLIELDFEGP